MAGVVKQIGKTREIEVKKCAIRAEERKQAVYFWKKWRQKGSRKIMSNRKSLLAV